MNRLATNFRGDVLSTLTSPLICYYDFLTAFKILEADPIVGKKNIFGQYQIEDMNTMWRCLKGWEDGRVHIAGAAECLAEKIQFEYPNIKKLASSLELHLANVTKRSVNQNILICYYFTYNHGFDLVATICQKQFSVTS